MDGVRTEVFGSKNKKLPQVNYTDAANTPAASNADLVDVNECLCSWYGKNTEESRSFLML